MDRVGGSESLYGFQPVKLSGINASSNGTVSSTADSLILNFLPPLSYEFRLNDEMDCSSSVKLGLFLVKQTRICLQKITGFNIPEVSEFIKNL